MNEFFDDDKPPAIKPLPDLTNNIRTDYGNQLQLLKNCIKRISLNSPQLDDIMKIAGLADTKQDMAFSNSLVGQSDNESSAESDNQKTDISSHMVASVSILTGDQI
ncbi:hypothetical protein LIER_42583 [Lithospermum erythrorhizon]|uniref:Uncharacterized protein n=1 Tax=Lithospermum erythrorhizon TaxID=34254 RepID=A0AAV3NL46_LITER